jgi:hypothetical protein
MTNAFVAALAALVASALPSPAAPASDAANAGRIELTQSMPELRRPTVCTEQYAPVCGRIGNFRKTFSNACFARAAGAGVITEGPCAG